MKRSIFTIAVTALLVGLAACTAKKRDNALPYGEDKDLLEISKIDGKEFDVTTIEEVAITVSNKADVRIQDETKEQNYLNFVNVKTDATLLADSPFRGKPNSKYKVRYVLENTSLKIYKLQMKSDDLSFEERQSAVELKKDNTVAAPVVSYDVEYYSLDNSRNELDEATHRMKLVSEQNKENATHVKIKLNSKTLAEYLQKDFVFPQNFFDGNDWYFTTSVVSENHEAKANNLASTIDYVLRSVSPKVHLKKEEGRLGFYSVNVDPLLKDRITKDEQNQVVFFSIPAEFIQYRFADQGSGKSIKEEEYKQKAWNNRPYMKLDLKNVSLGPIPSLKGSVRDVQVSIDPVTGRKYFSFSVYNEEQMSLIRYSLLEAKPRKDVPEYVAKKYWREDEAIFGFFKTSRPVLATRERNNEAFTRDSTFINRFNPKMPKIIFHPSDLTPEWTYEYIESAVQAWNSAFRSAGLTQTVEFNRKKVKVGDLRYNAVNLLPDMDGFDQWGGIAKSFADSDTGEIIAANSNVNLANTEQAGRLQVRRYIRDQLRETTFEYISAQVDKVAGQLSQITSIFGGNSKANQATLFKPLTNHKAFFPKLPSEKNGDIVLNQQELVINKSNPKGFEWKSAPATASAAVAPAYMEFAGRGLEFNDRIEASYENTFKMIETHAECQSVRTYVATAQTKGRLNAKEENDLVTPCARAVLKNSIMYIIMHEMGHNFGLRHNFYGSVDKDNFPANAKFSYTSSIMEYPDGDRRSAAMLNDGSNVVGWYDIAALRWGYSDKLFSKDFSRSLDTIPDQPLTSAANLANFKLARPFKYCTDEHSVGHGGPAALDAMCAISDSGTTATEIVQSYIRDFNYQLKNSLKLESGVLSDISQSFKIASDRNDDFLVPIATFYNQYRMMIEEVAPNLGYLESQTVETYDTFLKGVEAKYASNPTKLAQFKDLKKASAIAYTFFKALALTPDYYCVAQFPNDPLMPLKLMPFEKLQREIFELTNQTVQSCVDERIAAHLVSSGGSIIPEVPEVGYPLMPLLRDLNQRNDRETPVALGTIFDRVHALVHLGARQQVLKRNTLAGFHPNFFDEPQYRKDLEASITARITDGVSIKSFGNKVFNDSQIPDVKLPKFANESIVLNFMYETLVRGSLIPGKSVTNSDRMKRFKINFAYSAEQLKQDGVKVFNYAGNTFIATPENEVVYKLIDKVNFAMNLKRSAVPNDKIVVSAYQFLSSRIPEEGDKKYKISQFLAIFQELQETAKTNPKIGEVAAFVQLSMAEEIELLETKLSAYADKQMEGLTTDEEKKKKMAEILDSSLLEVMEKIGSKFTLTKATLDDRLKSVLVKFKKQVELYQTYQNDFDAQADILIQSVISGG